MSRPLEGWKLRRKGASPFTVRFTHAGTRFEIGTGTRTIEEAAAVAPRIYADIVDGVRAIGRVGPVIVSMRAPSGSGVYFLRVGDRIKIGRATNIRRRMAALQIGAAYPLELVLVVAGEKLVDLEAEMHARFGGDRLHGEWFRLSPTMFDFIRRAQQQATTEKA